MRAILLAAPEWVDHFEERSLPLLADQAPDVWRTRAGPGALVTQRQGR